MKKVEAGKPKRRTEFSLVRGKGKKDRDKVGKENQPRDVLQIIRTKEERLNSGYKDERMVLASITNNRLTHKLGLYGKAKHSDTIHREGRATIVTLDDIPQHDITTDTTTEVSEEKDMEYSPTLDNAQEDVQQSAEEIAMVLQADDTFGNTDYLYQLRCHLQRIMKQNDTELEWSGEHGEDQQQVATSMDHETVPVAISQSVPNTGTVTIATHHDQQLNLSLPTHYVQQQPPGVLSESHDTGGWIPYCSHDPLLVVNTKSPTPTHSLPFGVGLELTLPLAPPSTVKNDILDLLDSIPNIAKPLDVSPSPPKLLPHRLY